MMNMYDNMCKCYGIKPMSLTEEIAMPGSAKRTRNNKIYIIDTVNSIRKMLDTIEHTAKGAPEEDNEAHADLVQELADRVKEMYNSVDRTFYFSCTGKEKK